MTADTVIPVKKCSAGFQGVTKISFQVGKDITRKTHPQIARQRCYGSQGGLFPRYVFFSQVGEVAAYICRAIENLGLNREMQ